MPNEMIERVARLLWNAFATEGTYDEDPHGDVPEYLNVARSVLVAMRDPTEEMLEAGRSIEQPLDECNIEIGVLADDVWQTMIDAALK